MHYEGDVGHYRIEQTGPPGDMMKRAQYEVLTAVLRLA